MGSLRINPTSGTGDISPSVPLYVTEITLDDIHQIYTSFCTV